MVCSTLTVQSFYHQFYTSLCASSAPPLLLDTMREPEDIFIPAVLGVVGGSCDRRRTVGGSWRHLQSTHGIQFQWERASACK